MIYAAANFMPYSIGIYGARNTCTLVRKAGLSSSSFVSDLSTGYSGNLGFPLPEDWAFDQVKEYRLYYSGGDFGIDKKCNFWQIYGIYTIAGFSPFNTEQSEIPSLAKFIQFMWRKILRRLSSLLMSTKKIPTK